MSQNGVRAQSRLGVYFEWIFSRPKHVCRSASGAALQTLRPKASGLLKENPTHTMHKRISIYGDLVGHGFCFAGVSPVQEFKQTRTGPTENYVLLGPPSMRQWSSVCVLNRNNACATIGQIQPFSQNTYNTIIFLQWDGAQWFVLPPSCVCWTRGAWLHWSKTKK